MKPSLSVRKLSKTFSSNQGRLQALRNISFDIFPNEFVCLVGPSGCGKTTLLKIISGLIPSTRGQILIDQEEAQGPTKKMGIIFQDLALFPWFTVAGNIEFGLKNLGLTKKKRQALVKKYARLVGLGRFTHYLPHQLSGGMQQRVALARALAYDPNILLMDEPFSSLDAFTREKMQTEILRIWLKTKKTILFVTHDIEEAIYLGQRVMVMDNRPGQIKKIFKIDLPLKRTPGMKMRKKFNKTRYRIYGVMK
jgi:NitT/TauT family transport system ATP-binding protein